MELIPRHTQIVETIQTRFGLLAREEYFQFPEDESNLYMISPDGVLLWVAERVMEGDVYANPIVRIDQAQISCASWKGYDCEIDLRSGKLLRATFTK